MAQTFYFSGDPYDNGAGKVARKEKKAAKKEAKKVKNDAKGGTWLSRTLDNIKGVADTTSQVTNSVNGVIGVVRGTDGNPATVSTADGFAIVDPNAETKFLGMPKTVGIMVLCLVLVLLAAIVIFFVFRKKH